MKTTITGRLLDDGLGVGLLMLLALAVPGLGDIARVVPPGTPGHLAAEPYDTWGNAATNIQTAVTYAEDHGLTEVRVSNGWYRLPGPVTIKQGILLRSDADGRLDPKGTLIDGDGKYRGFRTEHADAVLEGLTITNCLIVGDGSAVHVSKGVTIRKCIITGNIQNQHSSGNGGTIWMAGGGVIDSCLFQGNRASVGGGVCLYSGTTLVTNCLFRGNQTSTGGGVGIKGGIAHVIDCLFTNNLCLQGGGGFSTHASSAGALPMTAMVERCVFVGNLATNIGSSGASVRGGAGVRVGEGASVSLRNCLIMRNRAINTYAGGLYLFGSSTTQVENCTIVTNFALGRSGGIAIYNIASAMPMVIRNTIVHGNQSGSGASQHNLSGTAAWLSWTNNCITTTVDLNAYGAGNQLQADPRFADPARDDWHLRPRSPCIDAGDTLPWMLTATDLDRKPRVRHEVIDIGCYEAVRQGTLVLFR